MTWALRLLLASLDLAIDTTPPVLTMVKLAMDKHMKKGILSVSADDSARINIFSPHFF